MPWINIKSIIYVGNGGKVKCVEEKEEEMQMGTSFK